MINLDGSVIRKPEALFFKNTFFRKFADNKKYYSNEKNTFSPLPRMCLAGG